MLYRKYDTEKRSNFIISGEDFEDLKMFDGDIERIKIVLSQKYKENILDVPPYHFIVTKEGVFEIKSTELAHNDDSFLSAFNDDIRFLLLGDKTLLSYMKNEISKEIASISSKYSMKISNNIIFVSEDTSNTSQDIAEIEKLSIKLRHDINPIMSVYETVVDNKIITNKDIIMISNRSGLNRLKLYADRFSVPIKTLIELNPHISINELKVTDTIFVPAVVSIAGRLIAAYCNKQSKFIHGKCRYLASKGANVDG